MSKRPFPKLQLPPGIGNGIGNSSSESLNSLDGSSRQTPAGSRPPAPPGHPPVPPPVIPLTLPHIPPRQFARSSDSLPAAIGPIMTTNTTSTPEQRPGMKPRLNLSEIMPAGADGPPKSNPTIQSNTQSAAVPLGSSASNIAASSIKNVQESDLQPMEELGVGSGGTVFKVKHKATGIVMAKKIIHQMGIELSKEITRELQILNQCQSPYIISFYGYYENCGEICICMEYMDVGSLEKICSVSGRIAEKYLGKITVSVLRGLAYLYEECRIIHRDIKPSNILMNSQGKVKICDFGVSGMLVESAADTFVGTGAYMSPERIQGEQYASQCDSWSLALSLVELAIGRYPYASKSNTNEEGLVALTVFELLQHIVHDPVPTLPRGSFSSAFCDFIEVSLNRDPRKRPAPVQLLSHPFVVQSEAYPVDMVMWARSFLEPNLNQRQIKRWSVAQKAKRQSFMENRISVLGESFDQLSTIQDM